MAIAAPLPRTVENLAQALIDRGCDPRAPERAQPGAADSGRGLDVVLPRLDPISERQRAEAAASLLGTPVVTLDKYPAAPPEFTAGVPERLLA